MTHIEQQLRMRLHVVKHSRDIERTLHVRHFAELSETKAQLHAVTAELKQARTESGRLMTVIETLIRGLEEGLPPEDIWRSARTSLGAPCGVCPCR